MPAALAGMAPVTAFAQSQEMTCICEEKCSEGGRRLQRENWKNSL